MSVDNNNVDTTNVNTTNVDTTNIKFGRICQPDTRDHQFLLKNVSASETKANKTGKYRKSWRSSYWNGSQGNSPSCVGYAWAHWLSALPIGQWLSPEGIYNVAQLLDHIDGENYAGTTVRAGAKVLQKLGYISSYHWAFNTDELIEALLHKGPIVVGTTWYSNMTQPYQDGMLDIGGSNCGGHSYLLNGVDLKTKTFRMKNSWSKYWGIRGHAFIKIDDFAKLLSPDGECCLGIEQRLEK